MEKKDNNNSNLDIKFISQSSEPFEIDQDIKNISLKPKKIGDHTKFKASCITKYM